MVEATTPAIMTTQMMMDMRESVTMAVITGDTSRWNTYCNNFHLLEVVGRYRDPQLQVGGNLNIHGAQIVCSVSFGLSSQYAALLPSKHDTLTQCWANVGPAS